MVDGLQHENEAAKAYVNATGNNVYLCGIIINPSAPWHVHQTEKFMNLNMEMNNLDCWRSKAHRPHHLSRCHTCQNRITNFISSQHIQCMYHYQIQGQMEPYWYKVV